MSQYLLQNQTTNVTGTGKAFFFRDGDPRYVNVTARGTFNGCTITIEESPDNSNWFSPTGTNTFTAAGAFVIEAPMMYLRASVTNAGGSTSVTVQIQ